jgi:hypothetical protein
MPCGSSLFDIEDPGREAEERWKVGMGIIDRLGGRGGWMDDVPEAENAGENERFIAVCCPSSSHPSSDIGGTIDINLLLGAGM